MSLDLFLGTSMGGLQQGLCYAFIALGMYIAYSILDFPDLTTDGSFPLGGVVGTILLFKGLPVPVALLGAFAAGALAGSVTGLLHVKFGVTKLLSGIIVMTALLSVTLALTKVLTGTGFTTTNFSYTVNGFDGLFGGASGVKNDGFVLLVLALLVVVIKCLMDLFFKTKLGFMLIAAGNNEQLITNLGRDVGTYKVLGLALCNGLVGIGGALYAQLTRNYDNTCGSGKVVLALASVIIGMALFSKAKVVKSTTAVIVGAVLYSLCLNYFTLLDSDGTYLKIMNAVCFAVILVVNNTVKRQRVRRVSEVKPL